MLNPKPIRDDIELPARHVEGGVLVNLHGLKILGPAREVKPERVFPVVRVQNGGSDFQPDNRFKGLALEVS